MNTRKPEPITSRDAPGWEWTETELAWIAKRDAQWAAWGYSLAPLTPAPEPVRFGDIRVETRSVDSGVASEIAFIGRGGKIVGYWAYGDFDPSYPYRG